MEYGFATHVVFWIIGLMTLGAVVASSLALFSMGRQSYRKD